MWQYSFLDELIIEDMLVMDRLEDMQNALEELTTTAKSRARNALKFGWVRSTTVSFLPTIKRCIFEPQDKLLLETLRNCQNNLNSIRDQERERYRNASYGSFEKSRRFAMADGLSKLSDGLQALMQEQRTMLLQEHRLNDHNMELIDSALAEKPTAESQKAREYLRKLRKDATSC